MKDRVLGVVRSPGACALLMFAFELIAITRYDYFRDELYYLASTAHLEFGYVDHPPLSIVMLAVWTGVFGTSLVAIRLLPALAGAVATFISVTICRRMGGGGYAQLVTGLATIVCGYLAIHHYYSMNSLDLLIWSLGSYALMKVLERPTSRGWVVLGLVLGLGLLNKISVLWLGTGLAVGLLATGHRRHFKTAGHGSRARSLRFSSHPMWSGRLPTVGRRVSSLPMLPPERW